MKVKVKSLSRIPLSATLWTVAHQLLRPWDFPGKNTGVGCHFLLQGIFLPQGLNLGLPHFRQTLYHLSHQGMSLLFIVLYNLQIIFTCSVFFQILKQCFMWLSW